MWRIVSFESPLPKELEDGSVNQFPPWFKIESCTSTSAIDIVDRIGITSKKLHLEEKGPTGVQRCQSYAYD